MTKSELIARLAQRYPQLVAKDAEYAVKMILDAMTQSLLSGQPHRDPRLRQLRAELPAAARRAQPEVRREGAGAGEVRAALQGRQGAARARRLGRREAAAAPQRARFPAGALRRRYDSRRRHAHRHLDDPPRRVPAAGRVRRQERRAGHAALLLRPRAGRRRWSSLLLGFFAAGALFGVLALLGTLLRQRREISGSGDRSGAPAAAPVVPPTAAPPSLAMEFEYWWLLGFPLFFGLGWIAARIDIQQIVSRIARAAALLLQGPQLPAERAARQGDRGLHRGGQGRPGDGRAALRARQPVPPARRVRPRHPHAPEPARARRPRRRAEAAGAVRARPGLPQGRASSTAPRRCSRSCERPARRPDGARATCSRSTSRRRTGRAPSRWPSWSRPNPRASSRSI